MGSIATWIVWARSWAEIPVLTPPAASIVTVNAVCSGASFFAAIRFSPSRLAAFRGQRAGRSGPAPLSPWS